MIEIELNNIQKNYGFKNVLNGINFEIKTGEKVSLIGVNGCGKTTILKLINKEELSDAGKINIRKNATIGYLKQIYGTEENNVSVQDFLGRSFEKYFEIEKEMKFIEEQMGNSNLEVHELDKLLKKYGQLQEKYISMNGYDLTEKFNKICSGFKFSNQFLQQKYNELSGGQKTIVNLAAILLKEPDILLLDEPTNHLDIETLEWLENFLKNYQGTVLVISHDRYFLDQVVTKTILIENGKEKIYFGNYTYFLEEDERRILAEFEVYKNQQKQIEKMKQSIKKLREFGSYEGNEMFFKRAKNIEKRLEKMEVVDKVVLKEKSINLEFNCINRTGKDVIKIENLSKNFGDKNIFNNFNLNVFWGEKVCLIGKNGCGKSTLLKIILGKDLDYTGNVKVADTVKLGYIPQEIIFEDDKQTVLDFFMYESNLTETQARTKLASYGFRAEEVFKKIGSLSGGEKVRIMLAKLMLKNINLLILDEPTNHIDISTREVLEENLKNYKGTLLFVSHDRYFIKSVASRVEKINNRQK